MKFRVLFVDTERVWRGGQEQLLTLLCGLNSNGHEVLLACPAASPFSVRAEAVGLSVTSFAAHPEFSPSAIIRLRQLLTESGCQVVHVNTPKSVLTCGIATTGRGIVRVASRRVNFPLRGRWSAAKYNLCLDAVFTVSASIREGLIQQGVRPQKAVVVYEGVDPEALDQIDAVPLPSETDGVRIGIIAHLSEEKGHRDLVAAMAEVVRGHPETRCYIVGGGPLEETLKRQAEDLGVSAQVQFTGFRNDPEAVMKRLHIFCLPSLSEGLSTAVMTAMACRIPVIASTAGSLPELVQDGQTGLLVPPGDPASLAEALYRLIESQQLRLQLGEAGRRAIEERFTVARKVENTEREYARLLALV